MTGNSSRHARISYLALTHQHEGVSVAERTVSLTSAGVKSKISFMFCGFKLFSSMYQQGSHAHEKYCLSEYVHRYLLRRSARSQAPYASQRSSPLSCHSRQPEGRRRRTRREQPKGFTLGYRGLFFVSQVEDSVACLRSSEVGVHYRIDWEALSVRIAHRLWQGGWAHFSEVKSL
jgi:hypothetical protein